jgi:hypothetical protein
MLSFIFSEHQRGRKFHKVAPAKSSDYKLYPNPKNGTMTLEYKLECADNALFNICSIWKVSKTTIIDNYPFFKVNENTVPTPSVLNTFMV